MLCGPLHMEIQNTEEVNMEAFEFLDFMAEGADPDAMGDLNPWDWYYSGGDEDDYLFAMLANLINQSASSMGYIDPEAVSWSQNWWIGGPANWDPSNLGGAGHIDFENEYYLNLGDWLETYDYMPEFEIQDYADMVKKNEFDKQQVVGGILDTIDTNNKVYGNVYGYTDPSRDLSLDVAVGTARLKDFQNIEDLNALSAQFQNDLLMLLGDLAETGAMDFINMDPDLVDFLYEYGSGGP
jgi:hypothetical protein